MQLKFVEIFDFKSIKKEKIEINANQLCFVGINESGKTSIIRAISYLNIHKDLTVSLLNKEAKDYPNGLPLISGVFQLKKAEDKELLTFLKEYVNFTSNIDGIFESLNIQIKRWGNGLNNISLEISDYKTIKTNLIKSLKDKNKKSEFLDIFFKKHYPIIEFFEGEDLLIEPATPEDLMGHDNKYDTFRRLLFLGGCTDFSKLNVNDHRFFATYIKTIEKKLNEIFKKHYRQDSSIALTIFPSSNNKLVLIITDDTEQSYNIEERSPGFQYYFAFLVNKLYYNRYFHNKNIIFLLDEPGNNLHPKGAKDLLKTFIEVSSKNLLFYTTHNPFLVLRDKMDSLIFVQKKNPEGTKVNRKTWQNKYQILRKELGILLNDSFLIGDINILVEGATEKFTLPLIFQGKKIDDFEWVNIYNVEGVSKMVQTLQFLGPKNLNQKGIVLLDSDEDAIEAKKKPAFINMIDEKNWAVIEVNDVFENKKVYRTFEDLFPQDVYIKAFNSYCHSIDGMDIGVFDEKYTDYIKPEVDLKTPILHTLVPHFYSFINDDREHTPTITKHDVMRCLFEDLSKEKDEKVNDILDRINALADLVIKKIKNIERHAH